jgi:hypothetical protein
MNISPVPHRMALQDRLSLSILLVDIGDPLPVKKIPLDVSINVGATEESIKVITPLKVANPMEVHSEHIIYHLISHLPPFVIRPIHWSINSFVTIMQRELVSMSEELIDLNYANLDSMIHVWMAEKDSSGKQASMILTEIFYLQSTVNIPSMPLFFDPLEQYTHD